MTGSATGLQRIMCKLGLHSWNKGRRRGGFLRRRCPVCPARQEQQFPGGGWRTIPPVKRVRRKTRPTDGEPAGTILPGMQIGDGV